jgi:ubiquinone/menaquinone biosynthesis C-methylase UbiE
LVASAAATPNTRRSGSRGNMGFYEDRILPHLVHLSMRQETFTGYRRRMAAAAEGRVLEVGVGSGLNLPFYCDGVTRIVGIDPSLRLLAMAGKSSVALPRPVHLVDASAEAIPHEDNSFDAVVTTWTLCTIPDVWRALAEMRRVLKRTGHLLFVEHGRSPDDHVRRWQDRLTPLWKRIGGGCHLNRPIRELLEQSGFRIEHLETGYMQGPKPMTYMYEGRARPS